MALTPKYNLPYLAEGAVGNIDVANKNFSTLEQLSHVSVIDTTEVDEPAVPTEGEMYLLPLAGLTGGSWPHHPGQLALFDGTAWVYTTVTTGTIIWDQAAGQATVFNGDFYETFGKTRVVSHTELDPVVGGKIPLFKTDGLVVLDPFWGIIQNGTGVEFQIRFDADLNNAGTNPVTTSTVNIFQTSTSGSFWPITTQPTLDADTWVWIEIVGVTGSVDVFNLTVTYSTT